MSFRVGVASTGSPGKVGVAVSVSMVGMGMLVVVGRNSVHGFWAEEQRSGPCYEASTAPVGASRSSVSVTSSEHSNKRC